MVRRMSCLESLSFPIGLGDEAFTSTNLWLHNWRPCTLALRSPDRPCLCLKLFEFVRLVTLRSDEEKRRSPRGSKPVIRKWGRAVLTLEAPGTAPVSPKMIFDNFVIAVMMINTGQQWLSAKRSHSSVLEGLSNTEAANLQVPGRRDAAES